jgi:hypothetical protein
MAHDLVVYGQDELGPGHGNDAIVIELQLRTAERHLEAGVG